MREFSKIYHNVWKSQKFLSLPDDRCRLLYLYILSCPHSNSSGCYDLKSGYVVADLEWAMEDYRKALDSLWKASLIDLENGFPTVLVTKWMDFNEPTNAKHALGIIAHLELASSPNLKNKRGQELTTIIDRKKYHYDKVVGSTIERLCKPYREAIVSLSSPRPDLDTDQRPRPDQRPDLDLDLDARENSRQAFGECALEGASLTPANIGAVHLLDNLANLERKRGIR